MQDKIHAIVARRLPQTRAIIEFDESYPPLAPKPGNLLLITLYSEISEELQQGPATAVNPLSAGAADVSFTSAYVSMALDGLGMSGYGAHTLNETALIAAL